MIRVAALYVEKGGVYYGLPDVDPWDEERDARLYAGPYPVVAHPPCAAWGYMAPVNQARYARPIGDDAGCFSCALSALRVWGGVLEHPAESHAWRRFDCTSPGRGHWARSVLRPDEWATEVPQRNYGHQARKRTWLLYVGDQPPALDWRKPEPPEAWISSDRPRAELQNVRQLCKKFAQRTPILFRDLLLDMARSVYRQQTLQAAKVGVDSASQKDEAPREAGPSPGR